MNNATKIELLGFATWGSPFVVYSYCWKNIWLREFRGADFVSCSATGTRLILITPRHG